MAGVGTNLHECHHLYDSTTSVTTMQPELGSGLTVISLGLLAKPREKGLAVGESILLGPS